MSFGDLWRSYYPCGHEVTPANSYTSRGNRKRCRICHKDAVRAWWRNFVRRKQ